MSNPTGEITKIQLKTKISSDALYLWVKLESEYKSDCTYIVKNISKSSDNTEPLINNNWVKIASGAGRYIIESTDANASFKYSLNNIEDTYNGANSSDYSSNDLIDYNPLSNVTLFQGEPLVNTNNKTVIIGTSSASNPKANDSNAIVLGAGKLVINSAADSTEDANTALSNGNVHINHVENNKALSSHKIYGANSVKVTTDENADIIVSSDFTLSSAKSISASDNSVTIGLKDENQTSTDEFEIKGERAVKATSDSDGNITLSADFELYTDKSAEATDGVNVYLKDVENNALDNNSAIDKFNIKGSGATDVTSDENGNIDINTEYTLTATQQTGEDANASNIELSGNSAPDIVTIKGGANTSISTINNTITISDTATITNTADANQYISSVSQTNGLISIERGSLVETTLDESANDANTSIDNGAVTVITTIDSPEEANKGVQPRERNIKGANGISVTIPESSADINVTLQPATIETLGGIKVGKVHAATVTGQVDDDIRTDITNDPDYQAVQLDKEGNAFVHVPEVNWSNISGKPKVYVIENPEFSGAPEISGGTCTIPGYNDNESITLNKHDILIIKRNIDTAAHQQYTAYVYDGEQWAAMDGSYSADNVILSQNLTITRTFGKYEASNTSSNTIYCKGKSLADLFIDAYSEDNRTIWDTAPSWGITISATPTSYGEVGETTTLSAYLSSRQGSYKFGRYLLPDGDIDRTKFQPGITYTTTTDAALYTDSDYSSDLSNATVTLTDNSVTYYAKGTHSRSAATYGPISQLGDKMDVPTDYTEDASDSPTTSKTIYGTRKCFYLITNTAQTIPTAKSTVDRDTFAKNISSSIPSTIDSDPYRQMFFFKPYSKAGTAPDAITSVKNKLNDSPAGTVQGPILVYIKGANNYTIDSTTTIEENALNNKEGWKYDMYYISNESSASGATWVIS